MFSMNHAHDHDALRVNYLNSEYVKGGLCGYEEIHDGLQRASFLLVNARDGQVHF